MMSAAASENQSHRSAAFFRCCIARLMTSASLLFYLKNFIGNMSGAASHTGTEAATVVSGRRSRPRHALSHHLRAMGSRCPPRKVPPVLVQAERKAHQANYLILCPRFALLDISNSDGNLVKKRKKVGAGSTTRKPATKKSRKSTGFAISTSSPLGMLALYLRKQWKKAGRYGLVFLAEDESRAERLGGIVHALDPSLDVLVFPRLNTLPFDGLEPSREIAGRRSSVLRRLARSKKPILLVSTAEAIMERLPQPASWSRVSLSLKVHASYAEQDIERRLEALGYDLDEEAEYPGTVLFHGKTFEIFPAGALAPYRIEHSGDAIRRIVAVDPDEHDVISDFKELIVDPMSDRFALGSSRAQRATFPDYCARARWIADAKVSGHADSWLSTIVEAAGRRDFEREYLGLRDWRKLKKRMTKLPPKAAFEATPDFSKVVAPRKALRAFVADAGRAGSRLLFVAAIEEDLRTMERVSGVRTERFANWNEAAEARSREGSLLADFDAGFVVAGKRPIRVVTASDVLGSRAHHPQPMAKAWTAAFDHPDIPEQGAAVVHLQRGLALLDRLQTLDMGNGTSREMIRLKFAGDDAVLVPPADLALIWPYAAEPGKLKLDKADGSTWWKRRGEAEQEIKAAAKQLARHIAQRRRRRAPKLVAPGPAYERFVARFPYFTTVDQAKAIRDVLGDLATGYPMDRVICGDVGFGKTEVALRAAAAVALSGTQVAVAVPTTVLARQHVETFRRRFGPFGIEVANLSRAASVAEIRDTKEKLRRGKLKVVVGTQALASMDVKFKHLGLVIVDEEQHFGAAEKAKLSGLAKGVHTLWMSATPIPRTLAAGLAGFRDLSVIATPPVHRLPIVTKVVPISDAAIAAALLREHVRHGQSFLICPRIQDLEPMLERVKSTAPDLRIVCLHGRLPAEDIDDNDELRRRRCGRAARDQYRGEWPRYTPGEHHRRLLAGEIWSIATSSAQRARRARRNACLCVFADRVELRTIRAAFGRAGRVQQARSRLCHQRA